MNVLIGGLNNYVGRRSVGLMADENMQVFAITRNISLFRKRMFEPMTAQLFEADLIKGEVGDFHLPNVQACFYFTQVPALDDMVNLKLELLCLRNYIHIVKKANCNRLVYIARLMDQTSVQPVLDLLNEFQLDYTVVLKSCVLGKGALLDRVFRSLAERRLIVYAKRYANRYFQPMGVHDFIRWLKALLHVPAFFNRVIEVGGTESMSFMHMFDLYRSLGFVSSGQCMVNAPTCLVKFIYSHKLDISSLDYTELSHLMRYEHKIDNGWQKDMAFDFSPLKDWLFVEK